MSKRLLFLGLTLAVNCLLLRADTVTIDPGEFVQYTFVSNAPNFGCPSTYTAASCDTLLLLVPFIAPFPDDVTAELFNGSTLLGSFSGICCSIAFKSSSSAYGSGSIVNFTSIQNGSIDGIIDLSSTQPFTITTDTNLHPDDSYLYIGNATGYGSTSESSLSGGLTGATIEPGGTSVPEPTQDASLAMLAFFGCAGLRRFARKRATS